MNKKNYTPKGFVAKGEIDPKKKLRESLPGIIILPIFLFVIILFLFDKEQIFFSFKDSIVEIFESNNFFKVLASLIFILIILLYKYIHYLLFISSFFLFLMGLANHGNKDVEDDGDKLISSSIIFLILGGIEIKYDIVPNIIKLVMYIFSLYF